MNVTSSLSNQIQAANKVHGRSDCICIRIRPVTVKHHTRQKTGCFSKEICGAREIGIIKSISWFTASNQIVKSLSFHCKMPYFFQHRLTYEPILQDDRRIEQSNLFLAEFSFQSLILLFGNIDILS